MTKKDIKMRVIGARVTAVLVAAAAISAGLALLREYPIAVLGALAMWALGNALLYTADCYLCRFRAIRREETRRL